MSKKIIELADKLKSKIYSDYNAGKHTWFRTGGNAKIFAIVEDNLELEIILNEINNENFYIIGSGSNLLIRDNGYNGTLIKLGKGKVFTDSIRLLYDQTLIIEGLKPDNPLEFAKRLNEVLNKSL